MGKIHGPNLRPVLGFVFRGEEITMAGFTTGSRVHGYSHRAKCLRVVTHGISFPLLLRQNERRKLDPDAAR